MGRGVYCFALSLVLSLVTGSAIAQPDAPSAATLPLPFVEGTRFVISQGYDASRDALPPDQRWIVGFHLSEPAAVVALERGTVVEVGVLGDGMARLVIEHTDGNFAYYMSLQPVNLLVQRGQRVAARTKVAVASGDFHFALMTRFPDGFYASQPIAFFNGIVPVEVPVVSQVTGVVNYESTLTARGAPEPGSPSGPTSPWLVVSLIGLAVAFVTWLSWRRRPTNIVDEGQWRTVYGNYWERKLVHACHGDVATAHRLMAYETGANGERPAVNLSTEELAHRALLRLQRDCK